MKHKATRKHRRGTKKTRRLRRGGAGPNYCQASKAEINAYKAERSHCDATGKGMLGFGCKDSKRCEKRDGSCRPIMRDPCGWY